MSVQQVIDTAIERCLEGRRHWNEAEPPELVAFLCGVIKSIVSDERKIVRRERSELDNEAVERARDPRICDDGMLEGATGEPSAVCEAIDACAKGDESLEFYCLAVKDGNTKRDSIAAALGWTPEAVSGARNKLQRRLCARFPAEFASAKKRRMT